MKVTLVNGYDGPSAIYFDDSLIIDGPDHEPHLSDVLCSLIGREPVTEFCVHTLDDDDARLDDEFPDSLSDLDL